MADYKELESVDEIFRKSFDALDAPSANGWDTPSEQVWSQVQKGIGTKDTGWTTTQKVLTVSAIALTLAIGIYVSFWQKPTMPPATPPPAEISAPAAANTPPADIAPAAQEVVVQEKAVKPAQEKKKTVTQPVTGKDNTGTSATGVTDRPVSAEQPADNPSSAKNSTPKPPNSIEKRKMKDQEKKDGQQ